MTQMNAPENTRVCPTVNGISTRRDRTCSIYYSNNINIKLRRRPKRESESRAGAANCVQRLVLFPGACAEFFSYPGDRSAGCDS